MPIKVGAVHILDETLRFNKAGRKLHRIISDYFTNSIWQIESKLHEHENNSVSLKSILGDQLRR
jgi:hypothetical protein